MTRTRWPKGYWMKLRSTEILKAFMAEKQFSMSRLARYAGCSKSMVGHLVSGHKRSCTTDLAERISEALGVPTIAIFEPQPSTSSGHDIHSEKVA